MKRRGIFSVTDKTDIEKFGELVKLGILEIISTGGTGAKLSEYNIPYTPVEEVTNFPEMLGGRLKTLHPNIFGGILADRSKLDHMEAISLHGIELIDLVVVNLYDFKGKPGIENIDIGGPSLIRACAKNGKYTVVVVDPQDYGLVISEFKAYGTVTMHTKEMLAVKAFKYTAEYDAAIYNWMHNRAEEDLPLFFD